MTKVHFNAFRGGGRRRLSIQSLSARRLLAAEIGSDFDASEPPAIVRSQRVAPPESGISDVAGFSGAAVDRDDVNRDGRIAASDALVVINQLRRSQRRDGLDESGPRQTSQNVIDRMDVDGDGRVSVRDALRIVNRMRRDRDATTPGAENGSQTEVQSFDGTGNHLGDPTLGAAGTLLRRLVEPAYTDGVGEANVEGLPSAREVSNLVFAQSEELPSESGFSNLLWQWGQFLDHDLTATSSGENDSLDIVVPTGDVFFDPFATGQQTLAFTRSEGVEDDDGVRQQVNEITAFIDGSMIYGSSQETANTLRAFEGGRMRTSEGDLLPIDEDGFFLAGDHRVNEQTGLIAMHTLWVREHNRLAEEIAAQRPDASDEEVFQRARRLVIAEIQAITFHEYLPQLIGRDAIPDYTGYDHRVDPSISNVFATAAFRYGHTTLPTTLARRNDDGSEADEGDLRLEDAFFAPEEVADHGIESILKGLSSTRQQEIDAQLVDEVRNFLFGPPGSGGFDLAALNIQRGRDHGLPSYTAIREALGLSTITSFGQITDDPEVALRLASAYDSVDQVDAWVGMLAEDRSGPSALGETASAVLAEQFTALRDGDRFYYENVLSPEQSREISGTRLSDIIARNTSLTSIQSNAFRVAGDRQGREVDVADRPDEGLDRNRQPRPDGPRSSPQDRIREPREPSRDRRVDAAIGELF